MSRASNINLRTMHQFKVGTYSYLKFKRARYDLNISVLELLSKLLRVEESFDLRPKTFNILNYLVSGTYLIIV